MTILSIGIGLILLVLLLALAKNVAGAIAQSPLPIMIILGERYVSWQ